MNNFKVTSLNHTGFTVDRLDDAIAFFSNSLGFELVNRAPRNPANTSRLTGVANVSLEVAYMRFGDQVIEILEYAADDRAHYTPRPVDVGSAHLAIKVDNIESAIEGCLQAGGAMAGELITVDNGPNAGNRICYVTMGHGTMIEIIQEGDANSRAYVKSPK